MFDIALRPWIDPPLNATGRWLAVRGVTADQATAAGFGIGVGAALSVAFGQFGLGLVLNQQWSSPGSAGEAAKV
jgi:hypothetical protein